MKRSPTGALAGVCVAAAGCTAVLGDFTSGSAAPGSDGGIDGTVVTVGDGGTTGPEGSAPADAPSEAAAVVDGGDAAMGDASAGPMACTTWRYPSAIVLETLTTGSRRFSSSGVRIFPLTGPQQSQEVRIIAGKSSGLPFTVYTVDASQTPPMVTLLPAPSNGQSFTIAHRGPISSNPYISIATYGRPDGGMGTYYVYSLLDAMLATGPIPAPFIAYTETLAQPVTDALALLPLTTTDVLVAITNPTASSPPNYVLGVGRATPTSSLTPTALATVDTTPLESDVNRTSLFDANGTLYMYDQNDPSHPGLSTWSVPDTAVVASPPTKRAISTENAGYILGIGQNVADATNPAADILYGENTAVTTTLDGGGIATLVNGITFRAGAIPYAAPAGSPDLDTWVSTDLPLATITPGPCAGQDAGVCSTAFTMPLGISTASYWSNDNIMMLGPGLTKGTSGVNYPGLNVVWLDSTGAVRSQQTGANNLLSGANDYTNASAAPISLGAASARWAVAYVETKTDDAGQYDVLEYNELDCEPAAPGGGGGDGAP